MRRDQVNFFTETNSNKAHADYGKTYYMAMMNRPFPKGTESEGATVGKSLLSYDHAYENLREKLFQSTGVKIGYLRDIDANDLFLKVQEQLRWMDDHGETEGCEGSALESIREMFDMIVADRQRKHEEQQAQLAKARTVWMRRYRIEYTALDIEDHTKYADLEELMETAKLNADNALAGWEHVESSEPWVTEITTPDGTPVYQIEDANNEYPAFTPED